MNQVYLSGTIADQPICVEKTEDGKAHTVLQLCVSHKTSQGEMRRELYPVNCWNNSALWAAENLKQGQKVALVGYLTQRMRHFGAMVFVTVEVTAQEFFPTEMKPRQSEQTEEAKVDEPCSE